MHNVRCGRGLSTSVQTRPGICRLRLVPVMTSPGDRTLHLDAFQQKALDQLGVLEASMDDFLEATFRPAIAVLEGQERSQGLLLDSLGSLTVHLSSSIPPSHNMSTGLREQMRVLNLRFSRLLYERLLEDDTATALLKAIARDIRRVDKAALAKSKDQRLSGLCTALEQHPFVPEGGATVDENMLDSFVGELRGQGCHDQLVDTLSRVKRVLDVESKEAKNEALEGADGAGICLAMFAAQQMGQQQPTPELPPIRCYQDVLCGQHAVYINIRGEAVVRAEVAMIWLGAFTASGSAYSTATAQLQQQLALMEWAVRTSQPAMQQVGKMGKLYVPRREMRGLKRKETVGGTLITVVGV